MLKHLVTASDKFFPNKILGKNHPDFTQPTSGLMERHVLGVGIGAARSRSGTGISTRSPTVLQSPRSAALQRLCTHRGAGPAETVITQRRGKSEIQAGSAGPAPAGRRERGLW